MSTNIIILLIKRISAKTSVRFEHLQSLIRKGETRWINQIFLLKNITKMRCVS